MERAFPLSRSSFDEARRQLDTIDETVAALSKTRRNELADSGMAGSTVHYPFSFVVAQWLAKTSPGAVSIDWAELDNTESLDNLLRHMLQPAEDEFFDSGLASTREWIDLASAGTPGTDFDWLMTQANLASGQPAIREMYDDIDLPLVWELRGSNHSISANVFTINRRMTRENGMRPRPRNVKSEIQRPLESIRLLPKHRGAEMIDVAMASLATRHRETYHFNYANPEEVYLADIGEGVAVAVFGLQFAHRFPLECTMGYLVLSNGVPIGYGGSSILFRQVNTGINIFDEYRNSEASYIWVQVMRVYHALIGSSRFIAHSYQVGGDNREAIQSGAFWFYYHLGFRPVDIEIQQLAKQEKNKRRRDPGYRSDASILRKLASCDMHLTLPGARKSELFNEEWLVTSSMLATRELGKVGVNHRGRSANLLMDAVARKLGIRSLKAWSRNERQGLRILAPFVVAARPDARPASARGSMRRLLRAKGGEQEVYYAQQMCEDTVFLASLRAACQRAQRRR